MNSSSAIRRELSSVRVSFQLQFGFFTMLLVWISSHDIFHAFFYHIKTQKNHILNTKSAIPSPPSRTILTACTFIETARGYQKFENLEAQRAAHSLDVYEGHMAVRGGVW